MWNHSIPARLQPLFWAKVNKDGPVPSHRPELGPCWLWTGVLDKDGYGIYSHWRNGDWRTGKMNKARAHMAAYIIANGAIPSGLTIDHLCRVRHCCQDGHLEATTVRVNTLRGIGPSAQNAVKTFCKRGHPLPPLSNGPGRQCATCATEKDRRFKAANRDLINERRRALWKLHRDELNARQRERRARLKAAR